MYLTFELRDGVESRELKKSSTLPHLLHRRGEAGEDDASNVDPEVETVEETTRHRMSVTSQVKPPKHSLGGVKLHERNPGQGEMPVFSLLV